MEFDTFMTKMKERILTKRACWK